MPAFVSTVLIASLAILTFSQPLHAIESAGPDFEDVLSLREARDASISPDGSEVVFSVRRTDWKRNEYDTEYWLAREGESPFQLTNTNDGSSRSASWSPAGEWIAFVAKRGDKPQLHLIRSRGGEAQLITDHKQGVGDFRWSPDGARIAFTSSDENTVKEGREKRYGAYAIEDDEYIPSHLWLIDVQPDPWPAAWERPCHKDGSEKDDDEQEGEDANTESESDSDDACPSLAKPQPLTSGNEFTVDNFEWSPSGKEIVFERRKNSDILSYITADVSVVDVESKEVSSLVDGPGYDGSPQYSPDGEWVLYSTAAGDVESDFYKNGQIKKIPRNGGEAVRLAVAHDEQIGALQWTDRGIFFLSWQKTKRSIFHLNPDSDEIEQLDHGLDNIWSMDFSEDGKSMAVVGRTENTLNDVYSGRLKARKLEALSSMTGQISSWDKGSSEVISWNSTDDTVIEGVLHKPADFDPGKQYPLLIVIHGGPTGISIPSAVSTYVYPIYHWVQKGALVLLPNYRGSAGYGEAFRSLNVPNLGFGDAWDVMSGVDHLIEQGIVDESRVGAMGWSQGGYISSFLTINTDRFSAISVGAGISNWTTYYVNTDIHPFTRQYLEAAPWSDPVIYAVTSPMSTVTQAKTPTLIQHCEFDRGVPTPNAYELYQFLQDVGVDTRFIIYKGFGHGITKPRERLAAVWHNWQWFGQRIWGEEVELPGLGGDEAEDEQ